MSNNQTSHYHHLLCPLLEDSLCSRSIFTPSGHYNSWRLEFIRDLIPLHKLIIHFPSDWHPLHICLVNISYFFWWWPCEGGHRRDETAPPHPGRPCLWTCFSPAQPLLPLENKSRTSARTRGCTYKTCLLHQQWHTSHSLQQTEWSLLRCSAPAYVLSSQFVSSWTLRWYNFFFERWVGLLFPFPALPMLS